MLNRPPYSLNPGILKTLQDNVITIITLIKATRFFIKTACSIFADGCTNMIIQLPVAGATVSLTTVVGGSPLATAIEHIDLILGQNLHNIHSRYLLILH